jgi:hypothetical protein
MAKSKPIVSAHGAFTPGPGEVLVGLFDKDRTSETIATIDEKDVAFRIVLGDPPVTYEQCGTAADGRRQYVPMT